jgi:O-antigen/teichoic acid export membrane protein
MSKSIVKNAAYKSLLSIFNIVIPILIGPYALRVLGAGLIGRVGFVESIYLYFNIFATFGIYQYGLREISRVRDNKEKLNQLFSSLFFMGLMSNILVVILYIPFVIFYTTAYGKAATLPVFIIYAFNILYNIFYVEWANEALERYDFITFKTIIIKSLFVILLLTLVKTPDDFMTYVILNSAVLFLNYFISFVYIKRSIKLSFKGVTFRPHLKYLVMSVILANANVLYSLLDKFALGQFVSEDSVAYYITPQYIISMINGLMMSIIFVTVPRLSNYLGNDDEKAYISLLDKVSKSYFAFLFPAALGIFALSEEVILLYGGTSNPLMQAIPVLKIFCIYGLTLGIESILTNQVIYVKRKENKLIAFILAGGLLNVIFKVFLIKTGNFDPVTAITTTCISNVVLIILEYIYIRYSLKLNFSLFSLSKLKYLFISLLFIPITALIKMYISSILLISLLSIIINASLYVFILILTKDEIINTFAEKLLSKLKR